MKILSYNKLALYAAVFLNIILEVFIARFETNVGKYVVGYVVMLIFAELLSCAVYALSKNIAKEETNDFRAKYYRKLKCLDEPSKNKITKEIFDESLKRSASVVFNKTSFDISVYTSVASILISLVYILLEQGEILLMISFIVINSFWMKFVIFKGFDYLDIMRSESRKTQYQIEGKKRMLIYRFYIGKIGEDVLLYLENKILNLSDKVNHLTMYLIVSQQIPNIAFVLCISFLYEDILKLQILIVIFMKVRLSVSTALDYVSQSKDMENDLKTIDDLFEGMTYHPKSPQHDIPAEVSVSINICRGEDKLLSSELPILICEGDKINFTGDSGSGKTTLFKALLGLVEGVEYDSGLKSDSYYSNIVWKIQNEPISIVGVTLRELFLDDTDNSHITKILKIVKLDNWFTKTMNSKLDTSIESMCTPSGGEITRLSLAITLHEFIQTKAKWLMLDEPDQGLDPHLVPEILNNIFNEFRDVTIIMITHLCDYQLEKVGITHKWTISDGVLTSVPTNNYLHNLDSPV